MMNKRIVEWIKNASSLRGGGGRGERGQALVLVALGTIVLIAFVALSIDGGMLYAQQRRAQNGADAAAMMGAYRLLEQQRSGTTDQADLRAYVNLALEQHGVPDTDGTAANSVNGNVDLFFTDMNGQIIGDECQVGSCSSDVAARAGGVHVGARLPFSTFFAAIVGFDQLTARTHAVGVVREGEPNSGLWAIFAGDNHGCGGFTAETIGSSVTVIGNAHSNADFKMSGSNTYVSGYITYKDYCHHCISGSGPAAIFPVSPIRNLALPSVADFKALTLAETAEGGSSPAGRIDGNLVLASRDSGRSLGSPAAPFTYISGDLTIRSNASDITLYGLIYVAGNVKIQGDDTDGDFTLVSEGEIDMTGATDLSGVPYDNPAYPILDGNGVRLYSALDRTTGSGNACNKAVIKISGSSNHINGTILAPFGKIEISGSNNEVNGALIGDSVSSTGSSNTVRYNRDYFPAQRDRIELVE